MRTSERGRALIREFEGLRLDAYQDVAGVWTIGYGSTRGVVPGLRITPEEADGRLTDDLARAEEAVRRAVTVPLAQSQFDSLASLAYNIGAAAFAGSTLVRKLNAGDATGAAQEFARWVHAGGKIVPGLERRRERERALFASGLQPFEHAPPAAPVEERPVPHIEEPVMLPPFIAAALPSLIAAVPELVRVFGSGEITERNARVAETVLRIAQEATGAANAQAAAETIQANPAAAQAAREAIRTRWYELTEVAGGIAAAREANAAAPVLPRTGLRFHELLTLLVVTGAYAIGAGYLFAADPAPEMAAALVTALVISALGAVVAYWFGSTSGSALKSELLARRP